MKRSADGICLGFSQRKGVAMKTFFFLLCVLAVLVAVNGTDCATYVQRTDVSRLDKIYKCLGSTNKAPKPVANQVCAIVSNAPAILDLKPSSLDSRSIEHDLSYLFQIDAIDRKLSGGDVIGSFPGLTREECSRKCTGDILCLSFSHDASGTCNTASTCSPTSTPETGALTYNMAYWYLA